MKLTCLTCNAKPVSFVGWFGTRLYGVCAACAWKPAVMKKLIDRLPSLAKGEKDE